MQGSNAAGSSWYHDMDEQPGPACAFDSDLLALRETEESSVDLVAHELCKSEERLDGSEAWPVNNVDVQEEMGLLNAILSGSGDGGGSGGCSAEQVDEVLDISQTAAVATSTSMPAVHNAMIGLELCDALRRSQGSGEAGASVCLCKDELCSSKASKWIVQPECVKERLKRERAWRNRESAKRSRLRSKLHFQTMEETVTRLRRENCVLHNYLFDRFWCCSNPAIGQLLAQWRRIYTIHSLQYK